MVTPSSSEAEIHLKSAIAPDKMFDFLAGFMLWVFLPIIGSGVIGQRDWGSLFLAAIPALTVVAGRCFRYFTPAEYVVLYPDRLEFPRHRDDPQIVAWSEVGAVRWPKTDNLDAKIEISLPADSGWLMDSAKINLGSVSTTDSLLLIRYLRLRAAEIPQDGWDQFCQKRVIPLIGSVPRAEQNDATPEPRPSSFVKRLFGRILTRPSFLGGVIVPPLLVLVLFPGMMSRRVWWAMAAIIVISAVVNVRIVWGFWVPSITQIALAGAALLFCFGLLAPADNETEKSNDEIAAPFVVVILWLAAVLIAIPMLINAKELGWLELPVSSGMLALAALVVLLAPAFLHVARTHRRQREQAASLEAAALGRWEFYEQTGKLPEAAPQEQDRHG